MISGCYHVHAYCDCADHEYGKPGCYSKPDEFIGRCKRDTDSERRQSGWIKVCGKDVCPLCKWRRPIRMKEDSESAVDSEPPAVA